MREAGFRRRLTVVIAVGAAARLILALTTDGHPYDMESFRVVRDNLTLHGIDVYAHVNVGRFHWPYASGFFPWISVSGALDGGSEQVFATLVRVPAILADATLAWLVQHYVGLRGGNERLRLAAAATVALGPVFVAVSGHHGQIDSLAILPAVAALVVWERMDGERRAIVAGALIGAGGALKTVPLLMIVPLLPSVRSWRELLKLGAATAAVPALALMPFLLATPGHVDSAIRDYHGFPGQGGLSLAVQPELMDTWLRRTPNRFSGLTERLSESTSIISCVVTGGVLAFQLRYRPDPALGASMLWLAILAVAPAFFFHYLIWGLPFFLMAGYVRAAVALQLAVAIPLLLYYLGPWESSTPTYVYVPIMLAVWIAMLVALAVLTVTIAGRRDPPRWNRGVVPTAAE